MKITSTSRYMKIAPSKAVPFVRLLKGCSVSEAFKITGFSRKKVARMVDKTLKSAAANVENNAKLSVDDFYVESVVVEIGPSARRYWHRSRGMARPIMKRSSHIKVILSDEKNDGRGLKGGAESQSDRVESSG